MQAGKIHKWRLSNFKNVNLWLKNSGSLSNSVGEENLWFLTFDLKHIDLLDEGCKIHDGCYEPGKKNCGCNQILIDYIDRNIYRMTGGQRQMAKVVRSYFAFENWKDGC